MHVKYDPKMRNFMIRLSDTDAGEYIQIPVPIAKQLMEYFARIGANRTIGSNVLYLNMVAHKERLEDFKEDFEPVVEDEIVEASTFEEELNKV